MRVHYYSGAYLYSIKTDNVRQTLAEFSHKDPDCWLKKVGGEIILVTTKWSWFVGLMQIWSLFGIFVQLLVLVLTPYMIILLRTQYWKFSLLLMVLVMLVSQIKSGK